MNLNQQQEMALYKLLEKCLQGRDRFSSGVYSTLMLIFNRMAIMSFSQMDKLMYKTLLRLRLTDPAGITYTQSGKRSLLFIIKIHP